MKEIKNAKKWSLGLLGPMIYENEGVERKGLEASLETSYKN